MPVVDHRQIDRSRHGQCEDDGYDETDEHRTVDRVSVGFEARGWLHAPTIQAPPPGGNRPAASGGAMAASGVSLHSSLEIGGAVIFGDRILVKDASTLALRTWAHMLDRRSA